jgi:putative ABC transport system ATP-binding protein
VTTGRRDQALEALEAVGLKERVMHRPTELSGGQQQRVAVARALVTQPAVLFADEPTGNLDSKTGDEVLALLRNSADELGQTIVMVTHDAHAATSADRVVFLLDGRIALDCGKMSRDEIYDVVKSLEAQSGKGGSVGSSSAAVTS